MPSPNIWRSPGGYEVENHAFDQQHRIEVAMRGIRDWTGRTVLDIGCGTGFHLPRWARDADAVLGIEPHRDLLRLARYRCRHFGNVWVRQGVAQALPVADASVDVVHARWSYFFGPGSEPGLRELDRVVRRGGAAFVIDNDATRSTFGRWFRSALPTYDPWIVERFWSQHGWQRQPLDVGWRFANRRDLEAVVRIEFAAHLAEQIIARHAGLEVDYAVNLWWRTY